MFSALERTRINACLFPVYRALDQYISERTKMPFAGEVSRCTFLLLGIIALTLYEREGGHA
jgi:hypothetical protein